jgi:DNA-binding MarR family transcriptional regulator
MAVDIEASNDAEQKILTAIAYAAEFEAETNIKLLTREAHLLRLIKNEPGHNLKYYLVKSGLSLRWYGVLVEQLVKANIVARERCEKDSRARRLK